jgi:hypothetical protein
MRSGEHGARIVRIAMWSGPRTISTALMRSWEARGDTAVWDEPFYAHYLMRTGRDHPGRDEIIAQHETDWRKVAAALVGPVPGGKPISYQKHMAHHMLPGIDLAFADALANCFLIRAPREMLASLAKVIPRPAVDETGLPRQVELFERERARTGRVPPVIDSGDVLRDPAGVLSALCSAIGVPYTERMLSWPPGPRATDGVWARHWYGSVWRSTGFGPPREEDDAPLPPALGEVHRACADLYAILHEHRLPAGDGSPLTPCSRSSTKRTAT